MGIQVRFILKFINKSDNLSNFFFFMYAYYIVKADDFHQNDHSFAYQKIRPQLGFVEI